MTFDINESTFIFVKCQSLTPDALRLFIDRDLEGSGKHGITWKEGPARAIKTNQPQGQFLTQGDLERVRELAADVDRALGQTFAFPDNESTVYLPDGREVPATEVYIKVYANGKIHAYPLPEQKYRDEFPGKK